MNIVEKYYWITNHPAYVPFGSDAVIEITPHMVCPETNRIENLDIINTKLQFWVELMIPYEDKKNNYHGLAHEWELDCGGDTWEEAVENLYNGVLIKYGDYSQEDLDKRHEEATNGFNFDEFVSTMKTIPLDSDNHSYLKPIVLYTDSELEYILDDITKMEILEKVLQNKSSDPSITMEQYYDIEVEQVALNHDLTIARLSLEAGYDVEQYGIPKSI